MQKHLTKTSSRPLPLTGTRKNLRPHVKVRQA